MRAAIVRCLALLGVALGLLAAPWEGWGDVPMWQRRDVTPAFVAMQRAPFWEPRDGAGEQLAYTLRVALSSQRLVDVRGAAKQLAAISAPSPSVRLKLGEAYFRTAQFAACHTILATLPSAEGGRLVAREAEGALMMHAQCLARDGQPEAALALLQRAMRRGDETANGWFLIGESLALLGRWRQAHEAFARSHQLQRSGSAAWAVAVFAELAAGQIEGEKAALAALSVDSRLTGWRRAYLGTAQTEVPTIAVPYEHLVQAIMYRTIESYAESLSMTRVALHALEATPPAAPIART
ncbi:MAG: hypothetical protein IPL79_01125 [Myxococcales bacterium]|nr:hypothetical protein [Myxococcales bacterium]